jgi:hypothetical protein
MQRVLIFLLGGALGVAAGFAIGIFVYPYVFLADIVAADARPGAQAGKAVAEGRFIHANPSDPIHYGKGQITLYERQVHIGQDFEVGPGPKFHVYLVPDAEVTPATAVDKTMFVDLGRLRAFKGSQNYAIPAGVKPGDYKSVVIWCEQFRVLISPARLTFAAK